MKNNTYKLEIKLAGKELYEHTLEVDQENFYTITGASGDDRLRQKINEVFTRHTPSEIIRKVECNMCTVRVGGVDFKHINYY